MDAKFRVNNFWFLDNNVDCITKLAIPIKCYTEQEIGAQLEQHIIYIILL